MMSFSTANLFQIVKKQYLFKLQANIDVISSLIGIQLLAMLFSLSGVGSSGFGSEGLSINVKYFSADIVIAFTMIWGFVTALTITTKPYRYNDFTFVTNRLTSNLSNICFLFSISVLGSVTAMLGKYLILLVTAIKFTLPIYGSMFILKEFLLGTTITILYVFLTSALGYFIGGLVQVNKLFIIVLPALAIGSLFIDAGLQRDPMIFNALKFYFLESSIGLFVIKALLTSACLFIASIIMLNRMEVRK